MAKKTSDSNLRFLINQTIRKNTTSLTIRNNRHFLNRQEAISILATSPARLNQAFTDLQKSSNPMTVHEDFDDFDGVRYYSLSGLYKLSHNLSQELTNRERRNWCAAIEIFGKKAFKLIIDAKTARQKEIDVAINAAKRRDGYCCQITGKKAGKYHKFSLVVHHIYSQAHYSNLAACCENLITLAREVHDDFHEWNGGKQNICDVDDLICFVNQVYPKNFEVVRKLQQIKQILGPEIDK